MDLTSHEEVLKQHGWTEEHRFEDGGVWYIHPDFDGDIIVQPEGTWQLSITDFSKEKILAHGFNSKDLEQFLKKNESKNKARSLLNLIRIVEFQEQYFGSEAVPFMLDALEQGKDISNKEKAVEYLDGLNNKYATVAWAYIRTLSEPEYQELLTFVKGEI